MSLAGFISRLPGWSKEIFVWLYEAKLVVLGLLVPSIAVIVGYFHFHTQYSLQMTGLLLECAGVGLGAKGLLHARESFGRPPLRMVVLDWFRRFPAFRRDIVFSVSPAEFKIIGSPTRLSMRSTIHPDDPIEKKVAFLIHNYEALSKELAGVIDAIEQLRSKHEATKATEAAALSAATAEVTRKVEIAIAGGVVESLLGLLWVLCGITLSTLSGVLI